MGLMLVGLISSPALAQPAQPAAPSATLSAEADGEVAFQKSKLIFSSWKGEEVDDSFPPIKWPRALRSTSRQVTFTVHTSELPDTIEIRQWRTLRRNGIPKGKPHLTECFLVDVGCAVRPALSATRAGWEVTVDVPWSGHVYIAALGSWSDGQVAWINHIRAGR